MTELKPCGYCGMPGLAHCFGEGGLLWICSGNKVFGGKCPDNNAYLTAEAWDQTHTRATHRTDGDDGELVSALLFEAKWRTSPTHGVCVTQSHFLTQAAARITALSAEVEHWKSVATTACDLTTGQFNDDQYVCKQRLDQTRRYLVEALGAKP